MLSTRKCEILEKTMTDLWVRMMVMTRTRTRADTDTASTMSRVLPAAPGPSMSSGACAVSTTASHAVAQTASRACVPTTQWYCRALHIVHHIIAAS